MFTVIDFGCSVDRIDNLDALPEIAREAFDSAKRMEVRGFQEVNGYIGRQMIWSCGGYWTEDQKFHITSMGNGTQLFVE